MKSAGDPDNNLVTGSLISACYDRFNFPFSFQLSACCHYGGKPSFKRSLRTKHPPRPTIQLQSELNSINTDRLKLNKTGMIVLGSWAVANIGYSGIQMGRTDGYTRTFHQMNVALGSTWP